VGIDNIEAAAAATRLLLSKGRRHIAAIGAQDVGSTATSRLRLEGYRQALAEAGLDYDPALVQHVTQFTRADGSYAAERLLASGTHFDAMFCFSDTLAFGAVYTLATHGITVPAKVAVVGFDNIEEGRYALPAFATISPDSDTASEAILDILASSAAQARRAGGHRVVPFTVVDRMGTAKPVPDMANKVEMR
jgi:DNA-binding LacI/PurR family transcriptional regulator